MKLKTSLTLISLFLLLCTLPFILPAYFVTLVLPAIASGIALLGFNLLLLLLHYVQPIPAPHPHTRLEFDDPTKVAVKYTNLEYCLTIGYKYSPSYPERI